MSDEADAAHTPVSEGEAQSLSVAASPTSRILYPISLSVESAPSEDAGLHDWYFAPSGNAVAVIDETITMIGAMILGKRAYGDQPDGFDTPYKVPHFILSHNPRPRVERDGASFVGVDGGIERALGEARAAAGGKAICIAGGASTAQQFLNAGLVDEVQIHLVSLFLGDGLRLFDHLTPTTLERTRVLESPGVTHLRYSVVR